MTIPNITSIPVANGGRYAAVTSRGRGSGRTSQWEFPDPMQMYSTSVPTTANQMRNRNNNATLASSVGGYGGGGVNLGTQGISSSTRTPVVIFAGNNAGLGQLMRPSTTGQGASVWFQVAKNKNGNPAGSEDYAVTLVELTAAYIGVTGSNPSLNAGLQCTGGGGDMTGGASGFAFYRTATNAISLGVQQAGGFSLTRYALTNPASFDETKQHRYSLLFVSASANNDAYVTAMIDRVPLKTLYYSTGAEGVTVPNFSNTVAIIPCIYYGLDGGLHVKCPAGFQVISAPTVLDALY